MAVLRLERRRRDHRSRRQPGGLDDANGLERVVVVITAVESARGSDGGLGLERRRRDDCCRREPGVDVPTLEASSS